MKIICDCGAESKIIVKKKDGFELGELEGDITIEPSYAESKILYCEKCKKVITIP